MRHSLLAVLLVTLAGCEYSLTPFFPQTAPAPAGVSDADLYAATVRVLTDDGFTLEVSDPAAGVVRTNLVVAERVGGRSDLLHAWHVVIEGGTVRVTIDCAERWEKTHEKTDCTFASRSPEWVGTVPRLREAIFARAQRNATRAAAAR